MRPRIKQEEERKNAKDQTKRNRKNYLNSFVTAHAFREAKFTNFEF